MKIWIVRFINEFDQYVFSSAEKAYNCILDGIKEDFGADDGVDKIIDELYEDYEKYPSQFGVEDYAYAEMEIVDEYC